MAKTDKVESGLPLASGFTLRVSAKDDGQLYAIYIDVIYAGERTPRKSTRTEEIPDGLRIDFDHKDRVMGIEIIDRVTVRNIEEVINEHLTVNKANGAKKLLMNIVPCSLISSPSTLRGQA